MFLFLSILLHQNIVLCGWEYLNGAKIADDQGLAALPPARYGSSSCYDSSLNALIVFGGYGPTTQGTGFLSDLWRFNLDTNIWQNLDGSSYPPNDDGVYTTTSGLLRPASRSESILICNPKDKRVFMVGGTGRNPKNSPLLIDTISFNDFWSYSLTLRRWNCVVGLNVGPLSGEIGTFPRARSLGTGAIDETNGLFYIHGGYNLQTLNYLSDVWQYNFDATNPKWLPLPYDTTGQFPRAMRGHSLLHDPAKNQLMVFGGETSQGLMFDVWTFSLDGTRSWRLVYGNQEANKQSTESRPGGRAGMSAVIDTLYRQIIVFGGRCTKDGGSRGVCNDVWVYNIVQRTWKYHDGYFNEYEAPSDFGNPNQRDGTLGARHGTASIWFTSKASNPNDNDDSWLYVFSGSSVSITEDTPKRVHNDIWRFNVNDPPKPIRDPNAPPPRSETVIDYSRNLGFLDEATGISVFVSIGFTLLLLSMYYWFRKYRLLVEDAVREKAEFKKKASRISGSENASDKPAEPLVEAKDKSETVEKHSDHRKERRQERNYEVNED